MMNISTAANVAEIGGGIAILVSLVYVGYQVRQSNRIASAAALQSVLDSFSERQLSQYLEHPEIMGILTRGHHCHRELSRPDRTIFNSCLNREIFQMQNVMQLRGHKLITDQEYQAWLAYTAAHIKSPGGSECWHGMKAAYNTAIIDCIEGYLRENPEAPSLIELFPYEFGDDAYREYSEKVSSLSR